MNSPFARLAIVPALLSLLVVGAISRRAAPLTYSNGLAQREPAAFGAGRVLAPNPEVSPLGFDGRTTESLLARPPEKQKPTHSITYSGHEK